jgi:hypothetical protein
MTLPQCQLSTFLFAAALLWSAASTAQADQLFKCVIDGTPTFQQTPCPLTQPRQAPTVEQLNAAEKQQRAAAASQAQRAAANTVTAPAAVVAPAASVSSALPSRFRCDGRQMCSQMTSCEEAKFFLANCPGVKMDGNRDGVPCEQQWCSR